MSSTIKDMLIRTSAPARLYSSRRRLYKAKYVEMNDFFLREDRSMIRLSRGGRAYGIRTSQDSQNNGGFSNISRPLPLQNRTRAQTISSSTPAVSDPTPIATKVLLSPLCMHVSFLSTTPISLDDGSLVMVQD
jgi:pyruvate,orthophosphate dikinase